MCYMSYLLTSTHVLTSTRHLRSLELCSLYDVNACHGIMKQVLKAVVAIHQQKIMHRDLKVGIFTSYRIFHRICVFHLQPKNIFLTFDDGKIRVKIGDFGLSRHRLDATHSRPSTPVTPHPGVDCSTPPADGPDLHENHEFFTSGVGTTTYAAPEQLSGSSYDEKVKQGLHC